MFNRILKKRIVIVSDREINAIGQCTGKMIERCDAKFHQFGSGAGNYTIAIIEHIDGTLECIDPECIKFIS
jgi:hypothetical protein